MTHQTSTVRSQAPGESQPDWRTRGACRDHDPDLMYPVGFKGPALLQIAEAKAVCARCPVQATCLAHALATDEPHGIWGGMTDYEREAIKRRNSRKRAS